jgi:hypothetical protein
LNSRFKFFLSIDLLLNGDFDFLEGVVVAWLSSSSYLNIFIYITGGVILGFLSIAPLTVKGSPDKAKAKLHSRGALILF